MRRADLDCPRSKRARSLAVPAAMGLLVVVVAATACKNPDVETRTYFEQRVQPVLQENCIDGTADNKCHIEFTDDAGNATGDAMGNLDLSSLESIHLRPDLLSTYGSYPESVMLLKAAKPDEISIRYDGEPYTSEIFHAGGGILSRNSEAFLELQTWLKNGATDDGQPPPSETLTGSGPCANAIRPDVEPFLGQATGSNYDKFKSDVQPILADACSFGSCHGSAQSDFFIACGDTEEERQHNYIVAQSFVAEEGDRSELLLRPLAPSAGGVTHSGGDVWASTSDEDFSTLREWANDVGPLDPGDESEEFEYFSENVMPALLRRGCAMPQCHSPQGFNDYRLRAGSRGFFSPLALRRNYEATLHEFVSLDTPDPNRSRILGKNVAGDEGGVDHRAGITLLEPRDMGGDPSVCADQADSDEGLSSYCVIVEWLQLERERAVEEDEVSDLSVDSTVPIIYVDRPANSDRAIDFATYRGDARLMRVDATLGEWGELTAFSAPVEIDLSGCAGGADMDVRGPEVSYDGTRLTFALRAGESDGLNVYVSDLDGGNCDALTSDGGDEDSGVAIHNFDPYFVPADPIRNPNESIVFASTRPGKLGRANVSPRYKLPASNIWRMDVDGGSVEQMTFLNGTELSPAIMKNGQITMTTEKATEGFYQLSGRRINWDLTDYHPLLAQRDSIGYGQATEIRESLNRDFLFIVSDPGSYFYGGALVTFNRSVGPHDPSRAGVDPTFLASVEFLDPDNEGAGQGPARGAYRSPYPGLDGSVLVSYEPNEVDLTDSGADVDYDLVLLDPVTGDVQMVAGDQDGRFQVEGIIVYKREVERVFWNIPELVFGGESIAGDTGQERAWAHFPDLPMLATLLGSNLRGQRNFDEVADGDTLAIYTAKAPPVGGGGEGTFQDWDLAGTVELEDDGSAFVDVPAGVPVIIELRRGSTPLFTMTEEHQFGPGELTSLGVSRDFFDGVCGGCHGSISGRELEVVVDQDALTGASISTSRPDPQANPTSSL